MREILGCTLAVLLMGSAALSADERKVVKTLLAKL